MGGRLEHEIRLLPQVLSCSFVNDDYVVVLVDPSADPRTIQLAAERILHNAGSEASVRVVGPPESPAAAVSHGVSPMVATATVATIAAIGVGSLVGGLAAVEHPRRPAPTHKPAAAPAAVSPLDTVDAFRKLQVSPTTQRLSISLPVETADHVRAFPVFHGKAAEAVSLVKALPPIRHRTARAASGEQSATPEGAFGWERGRHNGNGPRPWSNSVLLGPHDHHGHHGKDKDH